MPGHYGNLTTKEQETCLLYGDKNKVTRGDIIMAAKKKAMKKGKA